jgi:hypothetical protein
VAERTRSAGCGCLPFLLLVFLFGSFLSMALTWGEGNRFGALLAAGAGLVLLVSVVATLVVRARRNQAEDAQATAPPVPRARSSSYPASAPSGRSEREMRSGARRLTTEPESDEARALKRRLTEAVSDLADNVEEMPGRERQQARPLTSEEMIARAKERIRHRAENPDI